MGEEKKGATTLDITTLDLKELRITMLSITVLNVVLFGTTTLSLIAAFWSAQRHLDTA